MSNEMRKSRIIGMQFSCLSPEEIENMSVAEITSRDTYINNKPVLNGLFDPRMGVQDPGLICPTDGHDYIKTPVILDTLIWLDLYFTFSIFQLLLKFYVVYVLNVVSF